MHDKTNASNSPKRNKQEKDKQEYKEEFDRVSDRFMFKICFTEKF